MESQISVTRKQWNAPVLQRLAVRSAEGKGKLATDKGGKSGS